MYTSEQYKYLLLRRLQRDFSMPSAADRAYTYNFFLRLFEGITVTEAAYASFISVMDEELEYCAENGYYSVDTIPQDSVKEHTLLLQPAFAALGIQMDIQLSGPAFGMQNMYLTATAVFTKPDGTELSWVVDGTSLGSASNYFRINSLAGTEYGYATDSARYYRLEDTEPLEADGLDPHCAGPGLGWAYSAEDNALTVSGSGSFAGVVADGQLGCGDYVTLILSAEVGRLLPGCLGSATRPFDHIKTLVVLRPEDAPLTLDAGIIHNTARVLDVYTDNARLRAYSFPSNVTVNLHPLSEWAG